MSPSRSTRASRRPWPPTTGPSRLPARSSRPPTPALTVTALVPHRLVDAAPAAWTQDLPAVIAAPRVSDLTAFYCAATATVVRHHVGLTGLLPGGPAQAIDAALTQARSQPAGPQSGSGPIFAGQGAVATAIGVRLPALHRRAPTSPPRTPPCSPFPRRAVPSRGMVPLGRPRPRPAHRPRPRSAPERPARPDSRR